jgi:hypothetical protein
MAINPNGPNSKDDINAFSQKAEKFVDNAFLGLGSSLSVKDVLGGSLYEKRTGRTVSEAILLTELIDNLDNPILKGLAQDTISTLSNWFEDPEILCCLIQGIWAMYASSNSGTLAQLQKDGTGLADSNFAKWLDVVIAVVDLIIAFLGSGIKKISTLIPDLITEIMNGIVGAILLVLQEVLFALRDSFINAILQEIDSAKDGALNMSNIWAKCIPFYQLLDVLRKYISDYGLFAELFEKIKGFVSGLVNKFSFFKASDFPQNIKDLEFLYWFRDLLIKLKQAALNFDLCVFYGAAPAAGLVSEQEPDGRGLGKPVRPWDPSNPKTDLNGPNIQGLKIAADGTILQNTETQREQMRDTIPLITNSSTRVFLNKYYGYPLDVVDNIITRASSADSVRGTDINSAHESNLNADCPNSPSPENTVLWALRIRNRNL